MGKRRVDSDDRLSTVIENGADVERRILYLCGDIDEERAYRFIVGLHTIDLYDGPITVVMNTRGGLCEEGFAIYDAIQFARNEVLIIGFGQVSSIGAVIMQAGTKRMLSKGADMLIHDVSVDGGHLTYKESGNIHRDLGRLQDRMISILADRSGNATEQISEWCKDETTFTAKEAEKCGMIDVVLEK